VWTSIGGNRTLSRKSADGNPTEEVLYDDANLVDVTSWSPDGKFLLIDKFSSAMGMGIWSLPITPEEPGSPLKPTVFVDSPFSEGQGVFSPDGDWVAYVSNESQQNEIYVSPFPGPGKTPISRTGGVFPRWQGKEIFWAGLDGKLMAAEVTLKASSIHVVQVKPLGITVPTVRGSPYDVSLDGQRILAITEPERTSAAPLTLVQNWTSLLKK
jgi:Tol biopolymer transport system component